MATSRRTQIRASLIVAFAGCGHRLPFGPSSRSASEGGPSKPIHVRHAEIRENRSGVQVSSVVSSMPNSFAGSGSPPFCQYE
jgi:hypothetical protein